MTSVQFTLGSEKRLKSRKQIEQLFAQGKSFFVHPIKVFWRIEKMQANPINPETEGKAAHIPVKIGVSASKRHFKKATDRNRVKRLLRECYRLNQIPLLEATTNNNCTLQVFFIFVDKTIPTFAALQNKMVICIKRLQKIVEEANHEKLL
jgi:ribonuclease P protein component